MQTKQQQIADFVQNQFPGQFLIPVSAYARLIGESEGGCRNRISLGTFNLKVVQRGSRNFVAVVDVIDYLVYLAEGNDQPAAAAPPEEQEAPAGRRSKYGEAAKARAAAARAARVAKRQARAEAQQGGVA